jgi:hypothetical protein
MSRVRDFCAPFPCAPSLCATLSIPPSLLPLLTSLTEKTLQTLLKAQRNKVEEIKKKTNFYETRELLSRYDSGADGSASTPNTPQRGEGRGRPSLIQGGQGQTPQRPGGAGAFFHCSLLSLLPLTPPTLRVSASCYARVGSGIARFRIVPEPPHSDSEYTLARSGGGVGTEVQRTATVGSTRGATRTDFYARVQPGFLEFTPPSSKCTAVRVRRIRVPVAIAVRVLPSSLLPLTPTSLVSSIANVGGIE